MPRKRQPREIWEITRLKVLERDQYQCKHCNVAVTEKTAHIDHIQSGKRGSNHMNNLRALCRGCHVLRDDLRHQGMISKALKDNIIPPNWREHVWKG